MHRSHLTQELLNYFDSSDPCVRQGKSTLDAQLLNAVALQMEGLDRRMRLGRDAKYVSTCPLNVDNRGVWRRVIVPPSLGSASQVRGFVNGSWITLKPYSEELPVPSRVELDPDVAPVPISDLTVFSINGGDIKTVDDIGKLAFPNYLQLRASHLGEEFGLVDVLIEGYSYPETAGQQKPTTEALVIAEELPVSTVTVWSTINKITVRGLPKDATLEGFLFASAVPQVHDVDRPFTHAELRDQPMERFWSAEGRYLRELYYGGRFVGYEPIQSYLCPSPIIGAAVEPNTAGLWATDGAKLYYMDRRELLPSNLEQTGLVEEPLFNLLVEYDRTEDDIRYVTLTPVAGARADECHKHRFIVELSSSEDGKMELVAPDGAMLDFSPYAGWRSGAPKPVTIPVTENGSYLFTLETVDTLGKVTKDVVAYANLYFSPLASFDFSTLVPEIKGLAFDSRQRLWIWDGEQLVPVKVHYDAYVVDGDTNQQFVYLTDKYDQVDLT